MTLRSAIVFLLVVALSAPAARAQDHADAGAWRAFAEKLPAGAFLAVHLADGSTVKGHFVRATPEKITVLPKKRLAVPVRELSFDDVQSIEIRREGMSPGAKVLTAAGVAGGVLLVVVVSMLASGRLGG
jgi:hypothetical protein